MDVFATLFQTWCGILRLNGSLRVISLFFADVDRRTAGHRRLAERDDHIWLGAIHLSTSIDIHHTSSHLRSHRPLATSIRTSLLVPRRVRQPWLVIFTASKSMDTARFRHANNGRFPGAWLAWLKISYFHFEMVKCYISVKHS